MTKSQIKAELRRAACECESPWRDIDDGDAFEAAGEFCWPDDNSMYKLSRDDLRTFFLLVAEAL